MSFGYHTPEALLARSDSKNPATTCKGLTTAGRPCRRALAASSANSPAASPRSKGNGVVAVLDEGDAAVYFCWQHKDQAEALVTNLSERTQVLPLKQKSSIDTMIERIGMIELDDEVGHRSTKISPQDRTQSIGRGQKQHIDSARKRDTLPQEWRNIHGPLMSLPEEVIEAEGYRRSKKSSRPHRYSTSKRVGQSNVKASWGCCVRTDDDDLPPPRRTASRHNSRNVKPKKDQRSSSNPIHSYRHPTSQELYMAPPVKRKPVNNPHMQQAASPVVQYPKLDPITEVSRRTPTMPTFEQQVTSSPPHSQTATFLSLIPPHLSPTTTSALLSELSKPISLADEEGYIYIFWLTPDSDTSKPDDETASSLLDYDDISPIPSPTRLVQKGRGQRKSEVDRHRTQNNLTAQALQRFASIKHTNSVSESQKILLKIGRASNVHRRMSQWTKQCGQNITLIRYYPYHQPRQPNKLDSSPADHKNTVPHVHRVERLIHLELADQRVANKGKCEQCTREHKEWFEVVATREGVKSVDEVVRRWVRWAEQTDLPDMRV